MKHDLHHHAKFLPQSSAGRLSPERSGENLAVDDELLEELQTLMHRLSGVKVLISLYLVDFGALSPHLAHPLLREAAGSCALVREPEPGRHLVIYLGPEPSAETGGFQGCLHRGIAALASTAWAEVRGLRRGNQDIDAPAYLLDDLAAAPPRVLGITKW